MTFLEELRKLLNEATPRPWALYNPDDEYCMNAYYIAGEGQSEIDPFTQNMERDETERVIAITLLQAPTFARNPQFEENTNFMLLLANRAEALADLVERLDEFWENIPSPIVEMANDAGLAALMDARRALEQENK